MRTVVTTTDVFPICDGKMAFVWRKNEPMAERLWRIGGAMNPGETPQQAAARNFRRETKLEREPNDFRFISTGAEPDQYFMLVKNPLGDYWRQDSCLYYTLSVTPEELDRLILDPEEYDPNRGILLFTTGEIIENARGEFHESLGRVARLLRQTYRLH